MRRPESPAEIGTGADQSPRSPDPGASKNHLAVAMNGPAWVFEIVSRPAGWINREGHVDPTPWANLGCPRAFILKGCHPWAFVVMPGMQRSVYRILPFQGCTGGAIPRSPPSVPKWHLQHTYHSVVFFDTSNGEIVSDDWQGTHLTIAFRRRCFSISKVSKA